MSAKDSNDSRDSDGTDWAGPHIREQELSLRKEELARRSVMQSVIVALGSSLTVVVAIVAVSLMFTTQFSSTQHAISASLDRLEAERRHLFEDLQRQNAVLGERIQTLGKQVEELHGEIRALQAQQKTPQQEKTSPQ